MSKDEVLLANDTDWQHFSKTSPAVVAHACAAAFGWRGTDYFTWRRFGDFDAVVVPHPSGINHWYNDPGNCRRNYLFWHGVWNLAYNTA